MTIATNLSAANSIAIATGAATVTSNVASYFDEYQSVFTVGISALTCLGFTISLAWGMWIKWDKRKRQIEEKNRVNANVKKSNP